MKIYIILLLSIVPIVKLSAQEACLTPENLKAMDASWENALLELDLDFIQNNVAKNFIWVHNHAGQTDSKASLLKSGQKLTDSNTRNSKSRRQYDVKVLISGHTGIVTGFTEVVRSKGSTQTTYHFMRTYAETDGKCLLMANHTMAIPEQEED